MRYRNGCVLGNNSSTLSETNRLERPKSKIQKQQRARNHFRISAMHSAQRDGGCLLRLALTAVKLVLREDNERIVCDHNRNRAKR